MDITLINIKYLYSITTLSQDGVEFERVLYIDGYEITFLINKDIESNIKIKTTTELSIDEIKEYIKSKLKG